MPTRPEDYTVAWVCAIEIEYTIACGLLDQRYATHEIPDIDTSRDLNAYTFGRILNHHVVIACLPHGCYGVTQAAIVAERVRTSFPALQYRLMVGIAGGAPSSKNDIRLGDVVVSSPVSRFGGIVQYDFGKAIQNHDFEITNHLAPPPEDLLAALMQIKTQHRANGHCIGKTIANVLERNRRLVADYSRPSPLQDRLYHTAYAHSNEEECDCQKPGDQNDTETQDQPLVSRKERHQDEDDPVVHYGLIASANQLMKDAVARDSLVKKYEVLCFEMEAAGLINNFPCLVIRGICDYADSHKNKIWQGYAAATAAAYAKELLSIIPSRAPRDVEFSQADIMLRQYYMEGDRLHIERLNGDRLPMKSCYINLSLIRKSTTENSNESSSFASRLRLGSPKGKDQISLTNIFDITKLPDGRIIQQPRRVLIQGRAGMGKTTLCKKITHDFIYGKLWNKMFDRILWLPLRRLKGISGRYNIVSLINDEYFGSEDKEVAEDLYKKIIQDKSAGKTLFLLDGLDEISQEWSSGTHMYDFLLKLLRMPHVIITSRPHGQLQGSVEFDLELETTGFEKDQIDAYLSHCVDDESTTKSIQQFLSTKPLVRDLVRIPIQLDALCCCWNAVYSRTKTESITTTTLYQSISYELWKKDIQRLEKQDHSRILSDQEIKSFQECEIDDRVDMEEQSLESLAFYGLVHNIIEFTPEHQSRIFRELQNRGIKVCRSYQVTLEKLSFLRSSGNGKKPFNRSYHFLHLTFQEFFAAKHFVRHWVHGKNMHIASVLNSILDSTTIQPNAFLEQEKYNQRYNIFWRFVTGLIQMKQQSKLPDYFDALQAYPNDPFGLVHHELLMCCINEVDTLEDDVNRALRIRIFELLSYCSLTTRGGSFLLTQLEFPIAIFQKLLAYKDFPVRYLVLNGLKFRPYLAPVILDQLTVLSDTVKGRFYYDILVILHQQSKLLPADIMSILNQRAMLLLTEKDNRSKAAWILENQSTLPLDILSTLVGFLQDREIGSYAAEILSSQSNLPPDILSRLVQLLNDPDVWVLAASVYGSQHTLSNDVICSLVNLLKDKDHGLTQAAAILAKQNLPHNILYDIGQLIKAPDDLIAASALQTLADRELPRDILLDVLELLKHSDDTVSGMASTIIWYQDLSEDMLHTIVGLLQDPHIRIRELAARAIGNPNLPQSILYDIRNLLEDENPGIRKIATEVLQNQVLPPIILNDLVVLLKHLRNDIRMLAANVLFMQDLPQHMFSAIFESIEEMDLYIYLQENSYLSRLLKHPLTYAALPKLSMLSWRLICRHWYSYKPANNFTCYLYHGNFYVQDDRGSHKIEFTEEQIAAFTSVLQQTRESAGYPAV